MGYTSKKLWTRIIVNIVLFAIVVIIMLLYEFGIFPAYKSGFYCNDPALLMPYYDTDTVPSEILIVVSVVVPVFIIAAIEYVNFYNSASPRDVKKAANLTFIWYREYLVGVTMNAILVEIAKISIGKPRPCFYAVCNPITNCTLSTEYVQTFECGNTALDQHTILDVNRSFPSGHSSLSVQAALFMFLYIHKRCKGPWMLPLFLQVLCITWGTVTPLSRVIDNKHHWWDVMAGAFVGLIFTIYTVYQLCRNFSIEEKSSSKNFTLVMDRLTSKKLNHVVDNNISRDVEMNAI